MKEKKPDNLYPPWRLIAGQVPYDILIIIDQIQHWDSQQPWNLQQHLIFFILFIPYLIMVLSWFIRQRKEERIMESLLTDLDINTLKALKTFLGDLELETKDSKHSHSQNKTSTSKKASSTGKKANKKRGKKNEN